MQTPNGWDQSSKELVDVYLDLGGRIANLTAAGSIVEAISELAVTVVPGAQHASISERRNGRFQTIASTSPVAATCDRIQYELGSGPVIDAIADQSVLGSDDIRNDARWLEFGRRAHDETGALSLMTFRLILEEHDRAAALNLYATQLAAFDSASQVLGVVLATHGGLAIVAATARRRATNLEKALTSNRRVGMAMGILMGSRKLVEADAFTLLRVVSQKRNRKLTDIAEDVIETGTLELPEQRSDAEATEHPDGTDQAIGLP